MKASFLLFFNCELLTCLLSLVLLLRSTYLCYIMLHCIIKIRNLYSIYFMNLYFITQMVDDFFFHLSSLISWEIYVAINELEVKKYLAKRKWLRNFYGNDWIGWIGAHWILIKLLLLIIIRSYQDFLSALTHSNEHEIFLIVPSIQ